MESIVRNGAPRVLTSYHTMITGVLLFIVLFCAGCGGGTSGTGDLGSGEFRTSLSGTVRQSDGAPFVGAQVTDASSGNSTTVDSNGDFALIVTSNSEKVLLLIERDNFQASTELTGIKADQNQFSVGVVVDIESGLIQSVEVNESSPEIEEPDRPQPNATPSSSSFTQIFEGEIFGTNGTPISGASVSIVGTKKTSVTSKTGKFRITIPTKSSQAKLRISYLGNSGNLGLSKIPTNRSSIIKLKIILSLVASQPRPGMPAFEALDLNLAEISIK